MRRFTWIIVVGLIFLGLRRATSPAAAAEACLEQGGKIELNSLRSPLLKLPMETRVYLPPCYAEHAQQRYPVLYLIHGQNSNDDQWDRLGVDEVADRLIAAGEIPPFLIVMPRDRNWEQPAEDLFGRVLIEELVPWVDGRYRTVDNRQQRAIGGLSRGAGWAVHLGLSHPELFGRLGGHSLAVFWSDTGKIRTWLAETPPDQLPEIYLDIGDNDRPQILASTLWFENLLADLRIPHEFYFFTGYHNEAYWSRHVETYLRWYSQAWQP